MTAARVTIRVKPGASRTHVGGMHGEAIIVAVQPRAVSGKATAAALAALAEALGVLPRDVRLVTGATSRTKVVEVAGSSDLQDRLDALRAGAPD